MSTEPEIVYIDIVQDNECTNERCISEIQSLLKEISDLEQEITAAKDIYHESLVANLKKDFMIENLEKTLKKSKYDSFRGDFGDEIITTLTLMEESQDKDNLFIRTALMHLYQDDLSKLKDKTYSGRTKQAITPKKKEVLQKLFTTRMEFEEDQQKRLDRSKGFGKIMKNAIEYINKMN